MKRNRIFQVDPRNLDSIHAALHQKRERSASSNGAGYVAPRPGRESDVAAAWSEILGQAQIGRHDDFFQLGGNSIKAVQVLSLMRTQFGIEVPLASLFDASVLHAFAERTLCGEGEAAVTTGALVRAARDEPQPLSPAQERVWFLSKIADDSAYNIPLALRLRGEVQPHALEKALRWLIERHESLRTSFFEIEARPYQRVHNNVNVKLDQRDCRAAPTDWESHARREASRRFDLSRPPLIRALLLELAPGEYVLLVTMHHIVSDAWSIGVVVNELAQLYASSLTGEAGVRLSPMPFQLPDVAAWQRQYLASGALEADRSYWRTTLADAPTVLELPFDRPRPRVMSSEGSQLEIVLGTSLVGRLSSLATKHNATLYMVLLAAFKVLLHRYAGATDILVGTPVAGRDRSELENIVGFLANTIVLRTRIQPESSFAEHLARVKKTTIEGLTHQAVPFEQVVQDLAPQRSQAHSPLFQVMFILQNAPQPTIEVPGVELHPLTVHTGSSKFDITCSIHEHAGCLNVSFEYSTALFDRSTIARLSKHYETLLDGITHAPEKPISALSLLSIEEWQQIVIEWNRTNRPFNQEPIHLQIAKTASVSPDQIALIYRGVSTTYRELEVLVYEVESLLNAAGVQPQSLVGLCLERGPQMVAAMLAVWRVKAAYVPLDPNYPLERLDAMVSDATPAVILTEKSVAHRLPICSPLILIDEPASSSSIGARAARSILVASDTAYVIYTSGSTGRPKGVAIGHRSLSNFLAGMQQELVTDRADVWLAVTSLSFDIAALELLLPLVHGATVVLAGGDEAADGPRLRDLVSVYGVSLMQGTPATWMLLRECGSLPHRLRVALCGGEAWGPPLTEYLVEHAERVFNVYGPTETTIWSTLDEVRSGRPVTLGRPIANTEIYILDAHRHPTPIGVEGDLCIGGAGLALGYLNRPELTAERFIDHPFAPGEARVYFTGDRAKFLDDGRVVYLGRSDSQVKLRGFRIELGEIECVLLEHREVTASAVVLADGPAGKHLVGFVVIRGENVSADSVRGELTAFARRRLPDFMVPKVLHTVAKIPLTPNGKIDRAALATMALLSLPHEDIAVEPGATTTEMSVCDMVAELVGREGVLPADNFFEVGGHSLLGIRLLARVNDVFRVNISVRELFDHPTPRQLSTLIDRQQLLHSLTTAGSADQIVNIEEF